MKKYFLLLFIIISIIITVYCNEIKPQQLNKIKVDSIKNLPKSTINSNNQGKKTDTLDENKTPKMNYCFYDKLSNKYNYQVNVWTQVKDDDLLEPDSLIVLILNKSDNKLLQMIGIKAGLLFKDSYSKCEEVKSFITNFNEDKNVFEYPYFGLVIADFNFDSLEDFAIKVDEGGNGGVIYQYYIQDSTGIFHKDDFLSEKMMYFPSEIDTKNKELRTFVHASAYGFNENEYKYNDKTKSWKFIKQTYHGSR